MMIQTKQNKISNQLILYIILFSSLLTLLVTLAQLIIDYRADVNALDESILNIQTGYRPGISNAVWLDDKTQLAAILAGINALPDIEYIEVVVNSEIYAFKGERVQSNIVDSSFLLQHEYNGKMLTIGNVLIEANLSKIYLRLLQHAWTLLISNVIKTSLVVIFMYYLFNRLVFRRLNQIYQFVNQYDIDNLDQRIILDNISKKTRSDEITAIADALNKMQENLSRSVTELLSVNMTLDCYVDGIFMFHPRNYNIFYSNKGATQLLGYSSEELLSMSYTDISPEFNATQFNELINSAATNIDHTLQLETTLKHKNGDYISVRFILQYLQPGKEDPRFIFVAHDISELKKTETLLKESLIKANMANEAKSTFLMSMSHELRTPLNAILGFSQLLKLDADSFDKNQNEAVDDILDGGYHLLKLVEDILDLSKIEANKVSLSFEYIEPITLVDECVNLVQSMASLKNIQLENSVVNLALPLVCVDKMRFKQILINFLSNAIKYNHNNGSVTITYEARDSDMLRIKVSDTGLGIPASEMANVFTPFNRLGYEAGEIEGVGIGLNISKKLVELMHGHIDFASTVGHGSSFWIDLPCLDEDKLVASDQASS